MPNINIGKYTRPDIYTEYIDNSVITTPVVEGITSMVIGFSKKGPVNTPVRLTSQSDLEAIYGSLDRTLERKGSYLHRTASKLLESSPVWVMNLLDTDDNLDTLEYMSLSTSSANANDVEHTAPYRRFFDTTGFWSRDRESFINITKNNLNYAERVMNITNMSDKTITVFIFKSSIKGFDRTLVEWYGSVDKIPPYVNANDYASDYMIDVVVVGGDFTNYNQLAVDSRWSSYFSNSGLRKEMVAAFFQDKNTNPLGYYQGLSLIPYFRDGNGKNIFVETVLNSDTDRTGVFCAYNMDLLETDYTNGLIDLIGAGLVNTDASEINYLSYRETISESIQFNNTILDTVGNVEGIISDYFISTQEGGVARTGWNADGYVNNIYANGVSNSNSSQFDVTFSIGSDAYLINGSNKIDIQGGTASFEVLASDYPTISSAQHYTTAFILNTSGNITALTGKVNNTNPTPSATDVVLGYVSFTLTNGTISSVVYTDVTIDINGYKYLIPNVDFEINNLGNGNVQYVFLNTALSRNRANYLLEKKYKVFDMLQSTINSSNRAKMTMVVNATTGLKKSFETITISNIVTSSTANKEFTLNTGMSTSDLSDVLDGLLLIYKTDNEFILGEAGLTNKNTLAINGSDSPSSIGVVAKYSDFYQKFYNGDINSGDYFYRNYITGDDVDAMFITNNGDNYIVFSNKTHINTYNTFDKIFIPSASSNKGKYTVVQQLSPTALSNILGFDNTHVGYEVEELVINEDVFDITAAYETDDKVYLKMYLTNDILTVKFTDSALEAQVYVDVDVDNSPVVQSGKSNYKESLDIIVPSGYVQQPNKILVEATRYTNVKMGDFLECVQITSDDDPEGYVPRKLTRIISKKLYSGDSSLVEITCDSEIKIYTLGTGITQAMKYSSIDNYVLTYKGISLTGFRMRQDSMPDGTEQRQKAIMQLVGKGTPLFKAVTNKNAIDFRYLVDSFGLGLTEQSKQELVDICGQRLTCFGIINMPSMRQFKNSTSPTFVDNEGVLQTEYIVEGGNPDSNPAFLYSLGNGVGASAVGYFGPYVTVNDNGRPMDCPPAMYVADAYLRKFTSTISTITPWTPVAGITNGKITNITGLEMDFTDDDLSNFNLSGMNPIVYKRNRGYIIDTENTAQVLYKSALSYIHSREVCIELERELSSMLLDYQWKDNTAGTRSEVKLKADQICQKFVIKKGLYDYFNKCDSENNTGDIIENQIGVLDTYIEIVQNMAIIVNNIIIQRTGTLASGGFTAV